MPATIYTVMFCAYHNAYMVWRGATNISDNQLVQEAQCYAALRVNGASPREAYQLPLTQRSTPTPRPLAGPLVQRDQSGPAKACAAIGNCEADRNNSGTLCAMLLVRRVCRSNCNPATHIAMITSSAIHRCRFFNCLNPAIIAKSFFNPFPKSRFPSSGSKYFFLCKDYHP